VIDLSYNKLGIDGIMSICQALGDNRTRYISF